jgi:hypothetical protein
MRRILPAALAAILLWPVPAGAQPGYAWLPAPVARSLERSFDPPPGYRRVALTPNSFAAWLRGMPLKPDGAPIMLFDGRERAQQSGAAAIIDIDIGGRDLQQCADAVIRLRAEFLYSASKRPALKFDFTSGDTYAFQDWLQGRTPKIGGNRVQWVAGERKADNHASLRRWLDVIFTYAGSLSLQRELKPVALATIEAGDVLIQGGSPGHAVIVLDVARDAADRPAILLAQSYMPAQSVHVLRNPAGGVWYRLEDKASIVTPDWRFSPKDLRRFD